MKRLSVLTVVAYSVLFFLFAPLFIVIVSSFGENAAIQFPIQGFSLKWYVNAFSNQSFMDSFLLSLWIALSATLAAILVGVPAAYSLARHQYPFKAAIRDFFLSPTLIPGIVVGFSLFKFIVIQCQLDLLLGLFLGHFLISLPYVIRVVGSNLDQLDFSMEEAAWTLGASKIRTFIEIILPNIRSGIFASFMLAFINSFNNIPVSQFLSGPGVTLLPTQLMGYIEYNYDPTVSAISVLLMALTVVIMILIEKTLGLSKVM